MKHYYILAISLVILVSSCDLEQQQKDEDHGAGIEASDSIRIFNEKKEALEGPLAQYSDLIRKMFNEEGTVRGFDFGDTAEKIKDIENAEPTQECLDVKECDPQFIVYELPLNTQNVGEIMSIEYKLDKEKKIEAFQVDIFKRDFDNVHKDIVKFFSDQYGKPSIDASKDSLYTWTASKNKVTLNKVRLKGASGLKIQFVK